MSTPSGFSTRRKTQEIPPEQWLMFLAEFTRQNRGAHARLDVVGPDVGYQVQTDDRPFDGVAADVKAGKRSVWIMFGTSTEDHLTHGVHKVTAIRLLPATESAGAVLEVEEEGGTKTLLELSLPDAYTLPGSERAQA